MSTLLDLFVWTLSTTTSRWLLLPWIFFRSSAETQIVTSSAVDNTGRVRGAAAGHAVRLAGGRDALSLARELSLLVMMLTLKSVAR